MQLGASRRDTWHATWVGQFHGYVRRRVDLRLSTSRLSMAWCWRWSHQFDPPPRFIGRRIRFEENLEAEKLCAQATRKSLPYGGWYSMPRTYVNGGLIIGDSGSFLDSQRLKGIHLAMKSGMLAAETIFDALNAGDTSVKTLSAFPEKVEQSYIKKELWQVRNFTSFQHMPAGFIHSLPGDYRRARLIDPMRAHAAPGLQKINGRRSRKIQGRREADLRSADGRLSLWNAA
jgi:flavin-dependent dehydrogenase